MDFGKIYKDLPFEFLISKESIPEGGTDFVKKSTGKVDNQSLTSRKKSVRLIGNLSIS
ncbi:hypothetical protein GCM10007390_36520 [Persicitalea jodogahamensis]|uniref:Uncharacterized protein n=1 Tax=Persicitalea jodogahamensis TaxID=402147 RepID=A0A8J3D5R3_9BACT|nr:hypothetical protein GCM10007390_36520 [Persicitalea jodogahamensis]